MRPSSASTRATRTSSPVAMRMECTWMYDACMNRIALLALLLIFSLGVGAQDWPAKPVHFIVPSSPGGGTDLYARILGQALVESLKQQVVVENRPGASGNIGAAAAAKSAPD